MHYGAYLYTECFTQPVRACALQSLPIATGASLISPTSHHQSSKLWLQVLTNRHPCMCMCIVLRCIIMLLSCHAPLNVSSACAAVFRSGGPGRHVASLSTRVGYWVALLWVLLLIRDVLCRHLAAPGQHSARAHRQAGGEEEGSGARAREVSADSLSLSLAALTAPSVIIVYYRDRCIILHTRTGKVCM